jgi:ADP-heptose:LPS heptosyltransferase
MASTPFARAASAIIEPQDSAAADGVVGRGCLPDVGIFRILVCRAAISLGNTLMLTPLLREIGRVYPGAEIDIVTRSTFGTDVFKGFPGVRRVLILPGRAVGRPWQFLRTLRVMRETHYDLVIDPCPRSRTGRTLLTLARGTFKLGFAGRGDRSLSHRVVMSETVRHAGQRPVDLLRATLGNPARAFPSLDIGLSRDERDAGRNALFGLLESRGMRRNAGTIGIFANATGTKLLSDAWWLAFLDTLAARYPEHAIIEIVPAFGRSMLGSRYPAFYSSDIRRVAGVLSALTAFVSADCGVMHLACASGIPVTAIFSVSDAAEWGPYGARDRTIEARGLSPEQAAAQVAIPVC